MSEILFIYLSFFKSIEFINSFFFNRYSINLFDVNRVLRSETLTPLMDKFERNVVYRVTNMSIRDTEYDKKLVATIEAIYGTFSLYLPHQTYKFLENQVRLLIQMIVRARKDDLGLRFISGKTGGMEFLDL